MYFVIAELFVYLLSGSVKWHTCGIDCLKYKTLCIYVSPINTALGPGTCFCRSDIQAIYDFISYPLFADVDTVIYPHPALQYHVRPKAKCGIVMLSVDKFPYPWKQTRGNEFIPCSNNICDILKHFHSFKIPAITLIWPKSSYKHSVPLSLYLMLMTSNVRYGSIFHGC